MQPVKILCVDDEQLMLDMIGRCLKAEDMAVIQTKKGLDTLALLENDTYDLLILDLRLRDTDGFEVLKSVRLKYPGLPVMILSARGEVSNKVLGLGLGADDYMTKPFIGEELVAKIKAILRRVNRGAVNVNSEVLIRHIFRLDLKALKLYKNDRQIILPARLLKLFRFFMENPGCVFSKKQIYNHVWDDTYFDENTVMVYIRKLRQLVEDDPGNPLFIKTVWGMGYTFVCDK